MKILELADLHLDPKWFDLQKPCLDLIIETVKKNKIDFVCFAGDIYNRPVYNSDKDKFYFVLDFIEKLKSLSEIIMITGTPSHDAPGSYSVFEKMGCHVLNPAKPEIIKNMLFIGMPEINKISIMRKNNITIDEANIKIQKEIEKLIKNIWVPIRQDNKDKPCIFLGHGMFVDNINDKNPIIINTDVLIDNKILSEINADRYVFGHIHTSGESKLLNGGYVGYMGFDRTPWNNTGFQPGFNLIELDSEKINITRIDYPVVRKEKLKCEIKDIPDLSKYKNCDIRINLKITKSELKKINIHEIEEKYKNEYNLNSCLIVPEIEKEQSQRITKEQSDNAKSLWQKYCLFKDWKHPQNHESYMKKINEIEQNVSLSTKHQNKKIIKLLSLKIHGSIFSIDSQNKNTFYHDFSKNPAGLTLIKGEIGEGKSTFFGFAVTHPVFIGWDYRSLKEFFPDDGYIEKIFDVNEKKHKHYISIKKNKIECFWYVFRNENWEAITETASIKDFYQKCDDEFGLLETFISTSFFSQEPWRMKKYISSLTSASVVDLRNAYMNIVGIDRLKEKEYAKQKKDDITKQIEKLEIEKNVISNYMADEESIQDEKEKLLITISEIKNELSAIKLLLQKKQNQFDEIEKQYKEQKQIENKIELINNNIKTKQNDILILQEKIKRLEKMNIDLIKGQLNNHEKTKKEIELLNDDYNNEIKKDAELKLNKNKIEKLDGEKKNKLSINEMLNEPCEYCGKIKSKSQNEIEKNNSRIKEIDEEIELLKTNINHIGSVDVKTIELEIKKLKSYILSEDEITGINNAISEYNHIKIYNEQIENIEKEIINLKSKLSELENENNPFLETNYEKIKNELQKLNTEFHTKNNELSAKTALSESIKKQLEKISENKEKYNQILSNLDTLVVNHTEWEIIEKDMMSHKLPALELDLIASEIDFEVNKKLQDKFIIKTNTQYINKKGEVIDAFDILVYNPRSGIEKSILAHSPGQRAAYFNEPISQALRNKRQEKENIIFMWSIADETDSPIKHTKVKDYYEIMNSSLPEGHIRFIMSQKSEVYQFIRNSIDIKEIGINL